MPKSHRQRARLEQWLDNPRCEKNAASAVLNIPMQEIAAATIAALNLQASQVRATEPKSISEFARQLGHAFEKSLFEPEPPLMIDLLTSSGLIDSANRIEVINRLTGASTAELLAESHRIFKLISSADAQTAFVINGFRLPAEFLPPDSTLEIDILVARPSTDGKHEIVLGEVKVYPDKGGRTDAVQISSARSQVGLYAHIIRNWLPSLNETENLEYLGKGFFVLTDPATRQPILSAIENMDEQEARARTSIEAIHKVQFSELQDEDNHEKKLAAVIDLKTNFNESCWGRCAMAEVCFSQARAIDRTVVLGSKIERQLGQILLRDAVSLADKRLAPSSALEQDLAQRFADAEFPEIEGVSWKS
jgi:hypothetical protein